jgi:Carboxypeptidase regulatory-like domain
MKFRVALLSCVVLSAVVDGQTPPQELSQNCTVQGQIVQQPGAVPIRKANIRLFSIGDHAEAEGVEYAAVTDAEGQFRIEDVKPGTYRVGYDRAGFVDAEKRHHGDGMLLSLESCHEVKELLFHMAVAAVISGKVLDSDGDPVPNVGVTAIPYPRNVHVIAGFAGGNTNDLGEFRIGGLLPKHYLLLAQPLMQLARAITAAKTTAGRAPVYSSTYYPDTSDLSQAIPLALHAGDEVQANIMLAMVRPSSIRGEVSNLPAGANDASVLLRPLDDNFMAAIEPWSIDKNGRFEIREMLPGSYAVLLTFSDGGGSHTVRGDQIIQVGSVDIDGLRIVPLPNGQIHGQFRMDNGKKIDWSQVVLSLYSNQRRPEGSMTSSGDGFNSIYWDERAPRTEVKPDGSFEIKDVPAETYRLQVMAAGDSLADYFVESANLAGRDVSDSGFATTGMSQMLDIVVSARGASIEGTVMDQKNQPAPYVKVISIPDVKRRERQDLYHEATTDRRGRFSLRGLSPGEYRIMALDEDIDEEITDSAFVQAHESLGQSIKVDEGEHKSIILPLSGSKE